MSKTAEAPVIADVRVRILADVQKINIAEGDQIIITAEGHIDNKTAKKIAAKVRAFFGTEQPVLFLSDGLRLDLAKVA